MIRLSKAPNECCVEFCFFNILRSLNLSSTTPLWTGRLLSTSALTSPRCLRNCLPIHLWLMKILSSECNSFIHSFIHPSIHPFIHSFIHSFIQVLKLFDSPPQTDEHYAVRFILFHSLFPSFLPSFIYSLLQVLKLFANPPQTDEHVMYIVLCSEFCFISLISLLRSLTFIHSFIHSFIKLIYSLLRYKVFANPPQTDEHYAVSLILFHSLLCSLTHSFIHSFTHFKF